MIFCKELNQEFATKELMYAALKENAAKIISIKKAAIKDSDPVTYFVKRTVADKATGENDAVIGVGSTIYPVINTTNYLDSHGDVHGDGIWDNSIKDNKGKIFYAINHELKIGSIVAYPQNVEAYVETLEWSQLGRDYIGKTQALIYKVLLTEAANKDFMGAVADKAPIQNSVRMGYISIILCIDDSSDDYKQEYANFYKYLAVIANKQDAIDAGYYWYVTEAKIIKEGSAVLFGSNDATPIFYSDPADAGQKEEKAGPPESSQKVKSLFHNLI
ncbi:MAG TPA: hypothetical protein VHA52_04590 [Candidatus Babeliaceae bacterium]|nr:hypothetical protein [Candidatus Babeliaceae bacterium]